MPSWGSSAFDGNYICMSGSWGSAGNYNKTLAFYRLREATYTADGVTAVPVGMTVNISSDKTNWSEVTEFKRAYASDYGTLTSSELDKFSKTIDFSKYITPASGRYIYLKYSLHYRVNGANINDGYSANLTNGDLVDNSAALIYVKANEPPSNITFTVSNNGYHVFDKNLTISWTAPSRTGTYAPHHYKVWGRFSYDNGVTWEDGDNYFGPGWGVEGTSYTVNLSNKIWGTKLIDKHGLIKFKLGIATVDWTGIGVQEATRSTILYTVMPEFIINTNNGKILKKEGTDWKVIGEDEINYKNSGSINQASLACKEMTSNNYYIYNATDLRNAINDANTNGSTGKHYYLMNTIELYDQDSFPSFTTFNGSFHGNGRQINLPPGNEAAGNINCPHLFITNNGLIENLVVGGGALNLNSTSIAQFVGGICSTNNGRIIECYNLERQLSTSASNVYMGGIVGQNNSTGEIIKCLNNTFHKGSNNTNGIIGGIAGRNQGLIQSCGSGSTATLKGNNCGGICGYSLAGSKITDCYSTSTLNGTYVGGIVGYSYKGEIRNCYAVMPNGSKISGTYHGGICGYNNTGTYNNNYYCSDHFAKGSSEATSGTVAGTAVELSLMRDGWQLDMAESLETRLGSKFIHECGYNDDFPIPVGISYHRSDNNRAPGYTTSIYPDYIDEMSDEITLNFKMSNFGDEDLEESQTSDGKVKKLEVEVRRGQSDGTAMEISISKTINNPNTWEKLHFSGPGELILSNSMWSSTSDKDIFAKENYMMAIIKATWTLETGETKTNTLELYPYNLSKSIMYSSTEALDYVKNTLQWGSGCRITGESEQVMDGYYYPMEYLVSVPAGAHVERRVLTCTGQGLYEGDQVKDIVGDNFSHRFSPAEIAKRQNLYTYDFNYQNYYFSDQGTMDYSKRDYNVLRHAVSSLSDMSYYYGQITTNSGGGPVACLLEGTTILNSNNELVEIETLKEGDSVKTYNGKTKEIEDKEIYAIYNHDRKGIYRILLSNGSEIYATNTHKFFTKEKGIVNVMNVEIGNTFITEDNKELTVIGTKIVPTNGKPVYEIWTKDNENYFVGDDKILSYCEDINEVKEIKGGIINE